MIGKIQRVPLRGIWPHEERDFSRWLQDNIDVLEEVLDFSLGQVERERAAGKFSVDLVAVDAQGNSVIIENQLGKSDHDHLGKVVTYSAQLDAKCAIWIVGDARPEHIQAIAALNESQSVAYYMVKLEGVRIGNSPPAPLFTLIVGPSEEGKKVGKIKDEIKRDFAKVEIARREFWGQLLSQAKKVTPLHANISPGVNHWIEAGAGMSGLKFCYVILKNKAAVELYIDRGQNAEEENKKIFDHLENSRESIETAFGSKLIWQRLDLKRACRIKAPIENGGLADKNKWPEIQEAMIKTMVRFEKSLRPHLRELRS